MFRSMAEGPLTGSSAKGMVCVNFCGLEGVWLGYAAQGVKMLEGGAYINGLSKF